MKFSNTLIYWYLQNQRDLPWRKTNNPYFVWLSEIILQQTRVAQGLPYYLKFLKKFPTVFHLAKADESTVLKLWQGLGYYSRARNLHAAAKYIVAECDGKFPTTYNDLLKLKGVGDYTASAIASICFNEPTAVVDGNVYRVLARYFGIKTAINTTVGIKEFKKIAQTVIDSSQPGVFNQAIMDFGALHCKPQNPLCETCPFATSCVAFEKQIIKELPVKIKKLNVSNRYFNYLVVVTDDKKTIFTARKGKGIWQGLYQFPLLETIKPIDEKTLLSSEVFEKLFPTDASISRYNSTEIVHKLSHQHLYTTFWIVRVNTHLKAKTAWKKVKKHPTPTLIANFLEKFTSENKFFDIFE